MSMGCIKGFAVNGKDTVVCHHRKLQNHLVYLCLAVSTYRIDFILHGIQHRDHLLGCVFLWQIVSRAMIKQIAQQNQALCPFFFKDIQHFSAVVCRTMDI